MLVAAAYATLPWWMPKTFLANRIARGLTAELGLPVSIEALDMSWGDGVSVREVRIGDAPEFGGGDMVAIGSLRCDLSPIHLLWTGRLKWAELEEVRLRVVVREGTTSLRVNLAALKPLTMRPPPGRLVVRRASLTIALPKHDRQLCINVSDLQYVAGKLERVGMVTMSAGLAQSSMPAPLTLIARHDRGSSDATAEASFSFADVDLSQLGLPALLGLPLERLAGRAAGQLDCRISSSGKVERFSLTLRTKDLDVQPRNGPRLPVIEEAKVVVGGQADLVSNSIRADSFRILLPGVDLTGKALAQADALKGQWGDVRLLELDGHINPSTLAALLGDGPVLPGGVEVLGAVKVRLRLAEARPGFSLGGGRRLSSEILLDATEACVRIGGRVAKPAGRTLIGRFRGGVEERTWRLTVEQADLQVGPNVFRGRGELANVHRAVGRWADQRAPLTLAMVLGALGELDWSGSWQIVELESLRDMLGGIMPSDVTLDGQIDGDWSIKHAERVELHATVRLPTGTRLTVGRWFEKPADTPAHVTVSGVVGTDEPRLSRFYLWAAVGEAGVSIDEGSLTFTIVNGPRGQSMETRAEGRWSVQDAARVLACIPAARHWGVRINGRAGGAFDMRLGRFRRRLYVDANAAALELSAGRALAKPVGQPARVVAEILTDESAPPAQRNRLAVRAELGAAGLSAYLTFPSAGHDGPICGGGRLHVPDVAWLAEQVPALGEALAGLDVRGAIQAEAELALSSGELTADVRCDADELQFRLPSTAGLKRRGSALRLRLVGRIGPKAASIQRFALDAGGSSLSIEGDVRLAGPAEPVPDGSYWPPGVAGVDASVRMRLALDAASRDLWPALAEQARRLGLDGMVLAQARVRGDRKTVAVDGAFDARRLVASAPGPMRKPAGEPMRGSFAFTVPANLGCVRLRDLVVDASFGRMNVDGVWPLLEEMPATFQAALAVPDATRLAQSFPDLERYRLAGKVFAEVRGRRQGGIGELERATIAAMDLTGRFRGLSCRLDGRVSLDGIRDAGPLPQVGRVVTDGLEFQIGASHGFVVADVRNVLAGPTGRVELFSDYLDAHGLSQWLRPPDANTGPRLTTQEIGALRQQAQRIIDAARTRLAGADLRLLARVDRLRHFDPAVRAFFEVRAMAVDIAARDGHVRVAYRGGLNGGEMESVCTVNLGEERPTAHAKSEMKELLTGENILAQLAQEFPGNTVYGTFSRAGELNFSLPEALMRILDGRYVPAMTGWARTDTVNGLVRGRAAPRFITRIFPGLNLASYRYRRMTAFAKYLSDGSASNDMIFAGPVYDLYMVGTTDAQRIGRYEIGLILLGTPQTPEFQHRFRQGRIPILKFKARIENGRFYDEEVTYPWPTEMAYKIFLENNIFYRIWLQVRSTPSADAGADVPEGGPAGRKQ